MRFLYSIIAIVCISLSLLSSVHAEQTSSDLYKIVGYFPNWALYRTPPFKPENIDAVKLTHINYAFARVDENGTIFLTDDWADTGYRNDWNTNKNYWGHFRQLYDLKQKYPHLKVLISIGGWTLSNTFSALAANEQARRTFADNCVKFIKGTVTHVGYDCFDGVDIDWEYPCFAEHGGQPYDTQNFTLLLKALHDRFAQENPRLLLTIAAPAGSWHYQNIDLANIHQYVDWINLMTYDLHGPWGGTEDAATNHQSALYKTAQGNNTLNIDSAVQYYINHNVPPEKIVLGIPLYGRTYAQAASTSDGLYSAYSGPGSGTTQEQGIRFFSDIKKNLLGMYTRYWDTSCSVPYLHNEKPGHQYYQEFITYDDEESMRVKCQYIKQNQLGGAMVWELGLDTWATNEWHAMSTLATELSPAQQIYTNKRKASCKKKT